MTEKIPITLTKRVEGVHTYDDMPFKCVKCKENFFFTSKDESRWMVERFFESPELKLNRMCKDCKLGLKREHEKKLQAMREHQMRMKAKSRKSRDANHAKRKNRVVATATCDRCELVHTQEHMVFSKIKKPEGWRSFSSSSTRMGEFLCPECIPIRKEEDEIEAEKWEEWMKKNLEMRKEMSEAFYRARKWEVKP